MRVIESKTCELGTEIKLNYLGLESNGIRVTSSDDHTYITRFGAISKETECKLESYVADYLFPYEDSLQTYHFDIKYVVAEGHYSVKNYHHSSLFTRVMQKQMLDCISVIDFGTNQLVIKISPIENDLSNSILNIKVNHGINKGKELTINSKDYKIVKLGRKPGKDIFMEFSEESTSRIQLT